MSIISVDYLHQTIAASVRTNVSFPGAGTLVIAGPAGQAPISVTLASVTGSGAPDQIFISNADVTLGAVSPLSQSTYAIGANATLRISATVAASAGLTIDFTAPASHLVLDAGLMPGVLSGVRGFAPGSSIDVKAAATSLTYTDADGANGGGTLTLAGANGVIATVPLLTGHYTSSSFYFQGDGNGGTLVGFGTDMTGVTTTNSPPPAGTEIIGLGGAVTIDLVTSNSVIVSGGLPMLQLSDGTTAPPGLLPIDGITPTAGSAVAVSGSGTVASLDVPITPTTVEIFRFFENKAGTYFYTDDVSERQQEEIATWPDLVANRNATPAFSFVDAAHRAHFFAVSPSERDEVIVTRSDLSFEPSSIFYEQAVPDADDMPVYRFFDSRSGTHFYTDSTSERASILQSRPDLTAAGIGFYEPAQI